jgi:hypothetical protein
MQKSPIFPILTDETRPTDFLRNYLCLYYDACLNEAANLNLLLDCGTCFFKDTRASLIN